MNKFLTMSKRIGAVLIDLSGTIHVEDAVIPGSIEALKKLRATDVKVKFVTNTTKESKRKLHERLTKIGFDIHKDEIFTSLTAARQLIDKRNLRPYMLIADAAKEEFCDLPSENLNAVLVGLAPEKFNYEHLTTAFRYILEGAPLIAIHKARYYKRSDGLALGPGAFVAGLEYSTGCKAEAVGKPEATFFKSALEDLGCEPAEAVMIGDDARDDVCGAMQTGLNGILVKTGKYRAGDEDLVDPKPTFVADDFAHAINYVIESFTMKQ
ncbi:haloacid dehalogenase-like hydrolase domain-containing protein 2 [Penaeus chinensis]|uniref:haloacid dehalogenase-like hydrolase domain-containing protein 2 n=1 Tax=Penaeus chinensis TaxID=139456 RepID=UPI001FB7E393|nr:haloacid dehalogenase-like hydrolase domain-containing protein 2 [Penaeus chinensis]